uniref:Large ribosomal subunit protein mL40 n=1 Tax=Panagrolaimus sp. ES5 TaxID=591445 RepID=A0AC34F5M7_9BILA
MPILSILAEMSTKRVALFAKDRCLLSKSNGLYGSQKTTGICNDQYKSINLNHYNKCEDLKVLESKSIHSSSNNNDKKDKGTAAFTDMSDGFVDYKDSFAKNSISWKNNDLSKSFGNLYIKETGEKEYKCQNKDDENCNKSTLSLHIYAYENSIEAQNVSDICMKTQPKENKAANNETLKNFQSSFIRSSAAASQGSFIFPQQQQNEESMKPEKMQFKASQKLKNFNLREEEKLKLSTNVQDNMAVIPRAKEASSAEKVVVNLLQPVSPFSDYVGLCMAKNKFEFVGSRLSLSSTSFGRMPCASQYQLTSMLKLFSQLNLKFAREFHGSAPMWGSVFMKRQKKVDPEVAKVREARKRKKLEREIRDMQKHSKKPKPVEELTIDVRRAKNLSERIREMPVISEEKAEERALILKEYTKFAHQQRLADEAWLKESIKRQDAALKELKRLSPELYNTAIQLDQNLLPLHIKGPSLTPPIKGYVSPDGEYVDTTKSWK